MSNSIPRIEDLELVEQYHMAQLPGHELTEEQLFEANKEIFTEKTAEGLAEEVRKRKGSKTPLRAEQKKRYVRGPSEEIFSRAKNQWDTAVSLGEPAMAMYRLKRREEAFRIELLRQYMSYKPIDPRDVREAGALTIDVLQQHDDALGHAAGKALDLMEVAGLDVGDLTTLGREIFPVQFPVPATDGDNPDAT